MNEQFYFERVAGGWCDALFCKDRQRALAAASNLQKALRNPEGRDAALIAISEAPSLTCSFLPRIRALREQLLLSNRWHCRCPNH